MSLNNTIPAQFIELWKEIPGYKGLYEVSNFGVVRRRLIRGGYAEQKFSLKAGYRQVILTDRNHKAKCWKVHRLVMLAFVGKKPGYTVHHIDSNRANNCLWNLTWTTHSDNTKRAWARCKCIWCPKHNQDRVEQYVD